MAKSVPSTKDIKSVQSAADASKIRLQKQIALGGKKPSSGK